MLLAALGRLVVGLFSGLLHTRFGVPSFVITLAGLLGVLGMQLLVLGKEGRSTCRTTPLVRFGSAIACRPGSPMPGRVVVAVYAITRSGAADAASAAGLSGASIAVIAVKAGMLVIGLPTWSSDLKGPWRLGDVPAASWCSS